ncbi:kunitz-type serine protease inhibitor bitisilin-3-like [Rana temporaria]|uniref:kunitz-type serine protease inhibitor bitisilin-3-like n=1 Tax=Rana temporaria TaxID=8407 RepID=UPI001AAD3413|nr:kunitz-type serine protease inhibitor bitisilin-3-like [Rana temporaria]
MMWCALFLAVVTATQLMPARALPTKEATDICQLPMEVGPCETDVARYYFNSAENRCAIFLYGGCSGNANNFNSKQTCETACLKTKNLQPKLKTGSNFPIKTPVTGAAVTCQLPMAAGLCDNNVLRYFYNSAENRCDIFDYHGCFGNANNFMTKLECEKTCLIPEKNDLSDFGVDSELSFALEE